VAVRDDRKEGGVRSSALGQVSCDRNRSVSRLQRQLALQKDRTSRVSCL